CLRDWLKSWNKSAKPGGKPWDYNASRHNRARDAAAAVLRLQAIARTGDIFAAGRVQTECGIASASKKGTGNAGRADICYREGNKMFVWEVKSSGGASTGKGELSGYIADMKKDPAFKGLDIARGFDLEIPAAGFVGETNERVIARSHPTD
ncbi:hypothetical protein HRW10_35790, partial [Streptomyces lunaelactis]|nr:hypothetical protein [Streptomyces lunaelactis]